MCKMISEPMVRSTQTVHLSCIQISTICKWTELSLEPRHLGVPSIASKMISEPIVRLAQTVHLSCTDTNMSPRGKQVRFHMTHVTKEFHRVSKMNFEPMVRSTQTMHLSCIKISTISERTETRFHLCPVTKWYHQVRPK